jgi:hypothetical protein
MLILLTVSQNALKSIGQAANQRFSDKSFFESKAAAEDYLYRMIFNIAIPYNAYGVQQGTINFGSDIATSTLQTVGTDQYVVAGANANDFQRSVKMRVVYGSGTSFHFGLQSGIGGIAMFNTSRVLGNVYSNGLVTGASSNTVGGTVVSAGATGKISGIYATSSIYAHTIQNTKSDGDAYYQSIDAYSTTNTKGAKYPGSDDQPKIDLPIPDSLVQEWEAYASNTSLGAQIINCSGTTYNITSDVTIGPATINCDLSIKGASLTLEGPVWVKGNIKMDTTTSIIANWLGHKSVAIIADNPANRISSSKIDLNNSGTFTGAGSSSYVLMLSMNNSAENGGIENAIGISQKISGALLVYAGHGLIDMRQNTSLKEITAYQINLGNAAEVIYDSGLVNLIFTSGPGGTYQPDWYREVQ